MASQNDSFIHTGASAAAFQAIDQTVETGSVAVLVGAPGTGKTALLRAYAADRGQVLTYRAEVVNTPRSIVQALLLQLGVVWNGNTRLGFMAFRHVAAEAGVRAVLVDDAQRLSRTTLDMLRALHEGTGMAVVLAGTSAVSRNVVRTREELAHHITVTHEMSVLSFDDVLAFVRAGQSRKRRGYWECVAMARTLLRSSGGNFRRVVQILIAARKIARRHHRPLLPRFIEVASQGMLCVA